MNTTDATLVIMIVLVLINLVVLVYNYGRLNERVKTNSERLQRIEKILNSK